jgi:hypothetical protein
MDSGLSLQETRAASSELWFELMASSETGLGNCAGCLLGCSSVCETYIGEPMDRHACGTTAHHRGGKATDTIEHHILIDNL